ncbi:hypothetical protein KBA63_00160 [Candidatus Woesebacteria bacterium]|nr:hypothetical protein [Candidatus Woesebacteria bacterium]
MSEDKTAEELIKEKDKFMLRYLQAMENHDARLAEDHDLAFNKLIKQAVQSTREEERKKLKRFGGSWQSKFLNAGTEKGFGDLSMMISVVSEIIADEALPPKTQANE